MISDHSRFLHQDKSFCDVTGIPDSQGCLSGCAAPRTADPTFSLQEPYSLVTQEFLVQFMDLYNRAKQAGRFTWNYVIASCTLQYYHPSGTWSNDVPILALPVHSVAIQICLLSHRDIFYSLRVGLDLSGPGIFMPLSAWYTINFWPYTYLAVCISQR